MSEPQIQEFYLTINGVQHRIMLSVYQDGTGNRAIQTFDEFGIPNCRVTANPGYTLDEDVIAIRDDYNYGSFPATVQALVDAKVIEKLDPEQQIPLGYVTATLYQIVYTGDIE